MERSTLRDCNFEMGNKARELERSNFYWRRLGSLRCMGNRSTGLESGNYFDLLESSAQLAGRNWGC